MNKITASNSNRQAATTAMIEKKVSILKDFFTGKVEYITFPTSLTKFRTWESKELGLSKIGSPSSTNRRLAPHNARLIDEAEELIRKLSQIKKRPASKKVIPLLVQLRNKNLESLQLKRQIKSLTTQLIQAKQSYSKSSLELVKLLQRIETIEESNKSLRRDLILSQSASLKVIKK
jgi:hypothetical protein